MKFKEQCRPGEIDRDYYFEQCGECFDKWISEYDVMRRSIKICEILKQHSPGKTCIEIGCGTGRISKAIKKFTGKLVVSDISDKLASKVGEELDVSWTQQDACSLDIQDNSFDTVVSSECIEHTSNPVKALQEMVRILKKGGLIVVTSPNRLWYPAVWFSMIMKIRKFHGRENWLFPGQAAEVLVNSGIEKVNFDGIHLFPWQLPMAKRILPFFDMKGKWLYPLMINYCISGIKH